MQVGMWVVREVLSARDLETRVNTVKAFIKIALELFRINNFNATLEMVAGLENTAVHRLKKTWEVCPLLSCRCCDCCAAPLLCADSRGCQCTFS